MGTTADKLNKILETKTDIRNKINYKLTTEIGDVPFSEYAAHIANIGLLAPTTTSNFIMYHKEGDPELDNIIRIHSDTTYPQPVTITELQNWGDETSSYVLIAGRNTIKSEGNNINTALILSDELDISPYKYLLCNIWVNNDSDWFGFGCKNWGVTDPILAYASLYGKYTWGTFCIDIQKTFSPINFKVHAFQIQTSGISFIQEILLIK